MKSCGILLPLFALPSRRGVGGMGDADRFIEYLCAARQKYWQILPVNPCDFVNSPYASSSAMAGNVLFVDYDALVKDNLLTQSEADEFCGANGCDYAYAQKASDALLKKAYARFIRENPSPEWLDFVKLPWLNDYAMFCTFKKHFDGKCWREWDDEEVVFRVPAALNRLSDELSDEIDFYKFGQYVFFKQWKSFRRKVNDAGIKLIGDIPFYVAFDSAECWSHPELFLLDGERRPECVAGVPPDAFTSDGQLWGNPIYNWEQMRQDDYDWWQKRVRSCAELYDVLRIDHFRAFDSFYTIPFGAKNAKKGVWRKGEGKNVVKALQNCAPTLTLIAEDLGDVPPSVETLRKACNLSGMRVFQFGFGGAVNNPHLPDNYPEDCVAYLGTHDNDTVLGWFDGISAAEKKHVLAYCSPAVGEELNWCFIKKLLFSKADMTIVTLQDIAKKDTRSRINVPGTTGCWLYMADNADFSAASAKKLGELVRESGR